MELHMEYRRLGVSGLKVSALSFGSWATFGAAAGRNEARELCALAYDNGINFFDNAETYANGESERIMGDVLGDLRLRRDSFCVSSKVFFGSVDSPRPTQHGLSRKHIVDACDQALQRLRVDYLDLYFCHRPDPEVPMTEIVSTMDRLVCQGKVLYWGTSEWSAAEITEAVRIARLHNMELPTMEQPQYSLLHRERVEREYAPLYADVGLGTTIWSPLASGLLTGKYNNGIPNDSRLATEGYQWLQKLVLNDPERRIAAVRQLQAIAAEVGCSSGQLAIAWCLKNPWVSTVILGATRTTQLQENLGALAVVGKIDVELKQRIEACFA
jgi:voltage-dependent potassium channel beta subunit